MCFRLSHKTRRLFSRRTTSLGVPKWKSLNRSHGYTPPCQTDRQKTTETTFVRGKQWAYLLHCLIAMSITSKIGGWFLVGGGCIKRIFTEGKSFGFDFILFPSNTQTVYHLVLISFLFLQTTVRFMEIIRLLLFQHKAFQESIYSTTEASEVMIFGMKLLFTNSVLQMESITFYVVTAHHLDIRQEASASSQIKFLILWQ